MRFIFQILLLACIFSSCLKEPSEIQFKEANPVYAALSPTMTSLQALPASEQELAVLDLLKRGEDVGFPLIEESLEDGYVCATFIYLDSLHTSEIKFDVFGIYEEYRFLDKKLYRLGATNLYYRSYMLPNDLCFSYRFFLTDTVTGDQQQITDPLNKDLIPKGERKFYSWSVLDLRQDEIPWYVERPAVSRGQLDTLVISSDILGNTRNVYVYLPPNYKENINSYPVVYLFDSFIYLNRVEAPNVFDNLIEEEKIEPTIAVFIDNPTRTSRQTELTLNPLFKDFVVKELLPVLAQQYPLTNDPKETIIGGMSYGGLAASYIAFDCDSIFGNVLSQSGSYWRGPIFTDQEGALVRDDYLARRCRTEAPKKVNFYLDWGLQESWCKSSGRRFVRVLANKAYAFTYTEFNGWHDWSNTRKNFANALIYFLEGN